MISNSKMTDNQKNIWSKIEVSFPIKKKLKKIYKKSVSIKEIDNEKTLTKQKNINQSEYSNIPKKLFINKKRGRRLKKSKEINREGTHDRFSDDNLKRKVKTHFHNYIIAFLNNKLVVDAPINKNIKFGKIKSNITQNITVDYNQELFNKPIKDIIIEVSNKYQNKNINKECIAYVMNHQKENKELIFYLNMPYKEMYLKYYLKSTKQDFANSEVDESYEAHLEKLKEFGEKYLYNYRKNAENLIDFYKTCKRRRPRKTNEEKSIINPYSAFDISTLNKNNNSYIENENNINKNNDNDNDVFLGENKVSVGIQTDRIITDDESDDEY